jgi:hypothetical protein
LIGIACAPAALSFLIFALDLADNRCGVLVTRGQVVVIPCFAVDCGREAAAFSSFPSTHAPKTSETKAVAAATHQSAFGTAIFIAGAEPLSFENKWASLCVSAPLR